VMPALRNHAVDERQILAEAVYAVHHEQLTPAHNDDIPIVAKD
jgi:hypothetical protein